MFVSSFIKHILVGTAVVAAGVWLGTTVSMGAKEQDSEVGECTAAAVQANPPASGAAVTPTYVDVYRRQCWRLVSPHTHHGT